MVIYKNSNTKPDIILVVGGTRQLFWLLSLRLKGVPIVFRLDGINWLHRKRKTTFRKFLLAEIQNLLNKLVHGFLANYIIYQSNFVKHWWEKTGLRNRKEISIIYNGVVIKPKYNNIENGTISLLCVEGTIDYSPYAIELLNKLRKLLPSSIPINLYGKFESPYNEHKLDKEINYHGFLQRDQVNSVYTNAVFLSLDINPACPNSVIESMAAGLPVVAYDTGCLKELVPQEAGAIVPYGSNPWELNFPDAIGLSDAIVKVIQNYSYYSNNALKHASNNFSAELVFGQYLQVLNNLLSIHQVSK